MARRTENECAFCAEAADPDHAVIGADWKVYCSAVCAEQGELISATEQRRLMRSMIPSRDYVGPELNLPAGPLTQN